MEPIDLPMESIDLSGKFLLEAMFEKLALPKPHYFTRQLEQGGFVSIVEFYPNKDDLRPATDCASLRSPICSKGEDSLNQAASRAINYMDRQNKVLIDHNYPELEAIKHNNETLVLTINREWSSSLKELIVACKQTHQIAGDALNTADVTPGYNLKSSLTRIHEETSELQ